MLLQTERNTRPVSPAEKTNAFVAAMKKRTPDEIAKAREQIRAGFLSPRPLPLGKTREDVFVGALPGNDDADIIAALADME